MNCHRVRSKRTIHNCLLIAILVLLLLVATKSIISNNTSSEEIDIEEVEDAYEEIIQDSIKTEVNSKHDLIITEQEAPAPVIFAEHEEAEDSEPFVLIDESDQEEDQENQETEEVYHPIYDLIDGNDYNGISEFVNNPSAHIQKRSGLSPLHYASLKRNIEAVNILLESSLYSLSETVEIPGRYADYSALHLVCLGTENPEMAVEAARLLTKQRSQINATTEKGQLTPLHVAIANSNFQLVQYFLSLNAKMNTTRGRDGDSILHYAMKKCTSRPIIKALLDKDPKLVNAVNLRNQNPIHTAAYYGCEAGLRELILSRRQSKTHKSPKKPMFHNHLIKLPHSVLFDATPLHFAARAGQYATVEFLVLIRAPITALDELGSSPIDLARKTRIAHVLDFLLQSDEWTRKHESKVTEDIEENIRRCESFSKENAQRVNEIYRQIYLAHLNPYGHV
jgi:ankyrin repeat protein